MQPSGGFRRIPPVQIAQELARRGRNMRLTGSACAVDDVCRALGLSRRTLQRRLKEENTSFQQQLNHTRELLTKNYLRNTTLSAEDIAYLLGYQDLNSFYRAFSLWTGKSISEYKTKLADDEG